MSGADPQRLPRAARHGARLVVARGARAAEEHLLEEVIAAASQRVAAFRAGEAGALATPIRVIVPSRSLREHVSTELVRRAGRSLLDVAVQTHRGAALELLERARIATPRGDRMLAVLVRRLARRAPTLAPLVDGLDDGVGVVESAVRDLLDAGLVSETRDAVLDALAASDDGDALRAIDLVRVAVGASEALAARGLAHRSTLLARARALLEERGPEALPTAALWVHGFADATGLVAEWLEALARVLGGAVLIDAPPDPGDPSRCEGAFPEALIARMRLATELGDGVVAGAPASLELVRASGTTAEVRAVAARVRALLDAGTAPESIGIVARRLEPWRAALDAQLERLAIPFSAIGAGAGPDAGSRRIAALARLLELDGETPGDTWLDADARPASADADLRIAFHALGAGRLRDVVALDLDEALAGESFLPLPVRRGFADRDASEDAEAPAGERRNRRRSIDRGRLDRAQERARLALERLRAWHAEAPYAAHRSALGSLLRDDLGWTDDDPGCARAFEALDALDLEVPGDFALERDELATLIGRALEPALEPPLGGAGAGVQVLSAIHARGRTFRHLFVLGMNRDVFPRVVVADALLPDALRRRIRDVLPEMPVKSRARDEERYLFAELLSSSERVALTWQHVSEEGRARSESPFVVRLRMLRADLVERTMPALLSISDPETPRPAQEHAALLGLRGVAPSALASARALALREVMDLLPESPERTEPEAIARCQLAAIRELDPPPRSAEPSLSPWLGFAGERPPASPQGPELFVTRLEDLARCGWQMFLRRELGLEPVPDALDALPAPDALLRGRVVHLALQRLVEAQLGDPPPATLREALGRAPALAAWPKPEELDALVRRAAQEVARDEGVRLPGFAAALARRVGPMLEAARAADWSRSFEVLGAELESEIAIQDLAGRERRIGFRADRADRDERGVLRLTDYKTGRALHDAKGDAPRLARFEKEVRAGRYLQAPVYWLAACALAEDAEGRFLFLREDTRPEARVFAVDRTSEAVANAFLETARVALDAWDRGALLPRLVDPSRDEEPRSCTWCEVSVACVRGETAQRRRLRDWAARAARDPGSLGPAERALFALHQLGVATAGPPSAIEEEP